MAGNIGNNSENVYLSNLVKDDEKILWNGHPGPITIGIGGVILIIGISIILGAIVLGLIYAIFEGIYALYEYEYLAIIGILVIILAGVILLVVGISLTKSLDDPQTTEYYISSKKIIKFKYGQAKAPTPSLSMAFIPIAPAFLNHHHGQIHHHHAVYIPHKQYVPPKDVILALNLDQIKQITFDPSKENDTRLMNITFYPIDRVIQCFDFIHGELVPKVSPESKIEFKAIEEWEKVRLILYDLVPITIQGPNAIQEDRSS